MNSENFGDETIHEYIGTLSDILLGIDYVQGIEKVDRDHIGILLSNCISILNDY